LISENLKLPCGEAGCTKTFSDPSSRSKHRQKCHTTADEASGSSQRARVRKKKHTAAYPVSVHARVARHVEEHSGQDAKDILNQFATFAVHTSNPATPSSDDGSSNSTRRSASHSAPSAPSTYVYRSNYTIEPSLCELPGVFYRANDVPTDSWSIDETIQLEHQAYDANPRAAPTAWGYYPDAPVLARPQVPTLDQPRHPDPVQKDFDFSRAAHDQSCRCWDSVVGDLTMAPLRGQQNEDRAQGEGPHPNEAGFPFSYAGTGHVPTSDHQWIHPPIPNLPSSVYPRPNPRMLFEIR